MKKLLSALLLLLLIVVLTACGGYDEPEFRYTRLTSWDYGDFYSFALTSVEEYGQGLLLRGVVTRAFLTPAEVQTARAEGTFEINGETFTHRNRVSGLWHSESLLNEYTGTEIFLSPIDFGEDGSPDFRYHMSLHMRSPILKKTGLNYEVKVDGSTTVTSWHNWRESGATDDGGWQSTFFMESFETDISIFADDFGSGGALSFVFEDGRCTHVYFSRNSN